MSVEQTVKGTRSAASRTVHAGQSAEHTGIVVKKREYILHKGKYIRYIWYLSTSVLGCILNMYNCRNF